MRRELIRFSQRYRDALRKHLEQGSRSSARNAHELGRYAMALDLETLDMARVHERILIPLLSDCAVAARSGLIRRAGAFFAEAITPIEVTHRAAKEANVRLDNLNQTLRRRSAELVVSNRKLKREIVRRKQIEGALRNGERHYALLLEQSRHLEEQLRSLSRQLLSAQEEERKKISRELHDEIAQTLSGINLQLATLKQQAAVNVKGLQKKIAAAQKMVAKSVGIVHRFACELRPPALDDLGLIPALHSFVKDFAAQKGVRAHLKVSAHVEQLDAAKRLVLYRVAQEALTNVARHAKASRVDVSIREIPGAICMAVKDNGKSFHVKNALQAKGNKHLGLLGMRERLEMVGGIFRVESVKGWGTTVRAWIPFRNGLSGKRSA